MKNILMVGAAAMLLSTTAYAGTTSGSLPDHDGSVNAVTYTANTSDNQFEDAGQRVVAKFTLRGSVSKVCAIQGVDVAGDGVESGPGLDATINLGTIGISAGDDQAVNTLFTMTGPANVDIQSAAAGCNYENALTLSKNHVAGLVNNSGSGYDSNRFQANLPYAVTARFHGVPSGVVGPGTPQSVQVSTTQASNSGNFGAWRSPLDVRVRIPQVHGKGLVGGTYQDTLTLTLAIS